NIAAAWRTLVILRPGEICGAIVSTLSRRSAKVERLNMKKLGLSLILVCLAGSTLVAQKAQVSPIMSKDLTDIPGKEGLMLTVEYAPGGSDSIHRHNADTFVYVVDGSIVMQ